MSSSALPPTVPTAAHGDTVAPFREFAGVGAPPSALRAAIDAAARPAEPQCVAPLLDAARAPAAEAAAIQSLAAQLAGRLRERGVGGGREGLVQGLIQEFSLSSQEGVALMCLAEALLRIPDTATRDALIRDKIGDANWESHLGRSRSLFVNAATWGLLLTGKLVATHTERGLASALTRVVARSGEPLIRRGVDMAMRLMGEQFVTGETIEEALANAQRREAEGFRYSYDMLGEAAMTAADAQRYHDSYTASIHAIGRAAGGRGIIEGPGISVKLSALHPRYSRAQRDRVMAELAARLLELALLARHYDIAINIDAEEADRLDISLDLLERLCGEPALAGWNGIGFVVQTYQKRAPAVVDFVIDLARRSRRRLMIRLVKGAYWDAEIKRAQIDGLADFPVFTRKTHSDVCYLACARRLLAEPKAIYPQFATHNAHTVAAIYHAAGPRFEPQQYEFQCLHGMGEPLYEQVVAGSGSGLARPCRIYAPVGTHETLLAYLVRRLLENGSNSSFVNRIANEAVPLDDLVADPVAQVEVQARIDGIVGAPHPSIALPPALFGPARRNSQGLDLASEQQLTALQQALQASARTRWQAQPARVGGAEIAAEIRNPADRRDVVGTVIEARADDVAAALTAAAAAQARWQVQPAAERAALLEHAADAMEAHMPHLLGLIIREAGKTCANAVGEVREAVDFLRYYAAQARTELGSGQGQPLGPVVCISPWNFPLAIFTGQVAAALAAGNTVLAKPAEQTPLIAAQAVALLHEAGVPRDVLQLLPGRGESVGAALVADERVRGVMFTGSTEVARILQRSLAGRLDERGRPLTLIAETGGQNAMIVDSSALPEQVVTDVLASAFDSAGQRCSALRVLCLQVDIADRILPMLEGAMRELRVGPPDRLSTDVGPVIDEDARHGIEAHIAAMRARGRRVVQAAHDDAGPDDARLSHGTFVLPTLIELESIGELDREVFGPVLHVLRYRRDELPALLDAINRTGYGLTLGIHSRIDETIDAIVGRAHVGNQYVNRNMIGAVVGVQPFGGDGLSGTGPKAGGPLYLRRLLQPAPPVPKPDDSPAGDDGAVRAAALAHLRELRQTLAVRQPADALLADCDALIAATPLGWTTTLPGPTGERNTYALVPRGAVLTIAQTHADRMYQFAAVLAAGARALWIDSAESRATLAELPHPLRARVELAPDPLATGIELDTAWVQADAPTVRDWSLRLAQRPGAIVSLHASAPGERIAPFDRLLVERSVSVNTAAAGGNASLMTLG